MAKNTQIKDIQADVKRVEDFTSHTTQFLKVDQTFEVMQMLLQDHNDRFVKKVLNSILSLLHQRDEATTSHSICPDGSNSQTTAASRQIFSVLQPHPHMTVDIPKFSTVHAMQWLYKVECFFRVYSIPDDQNVSIII